MEFLGMTRKKIRAAGYPRVSDENLKDSPTLDSQEKDIRRHIAAHEYDLSEDHMYPEAMTAYYKPFRERPQLMKLLDAARRKEFDVVVVTEFSRLSRRQVEQAVIICILESYGVKVESCTEKFEDSSIGHFMRAVYAFLAELEREKIVYRTTRGKMDRLNNGNLPGLGIPTYGYEYIDTEDETSARYIIKTQIVYVDRDGIAWTEPQVVIFIYEKAEQGWSVRRIAITLTEMGIPTSRGKSVWSNNQVHRILTNRMYLGEAIANKWMQDENHNPIPRPEEERIQLPDGLVPPILIDANRLPNVALFDAVQEKLKLNKVESLRNNKHSGEELGLLRAGLAKCGICGYTLRVHYHNGIYGRMKTPHAPEYYCRKRTGKEDLKNHHATTIVLSALDVVAWEFALPYIKDPYLVRQRVQQLREEAKSNSNIQEIENTVADIKRQMANLFKLAQAAEDDDTIGNLQGMLKDLERQKRDAEKMLYEEEEEEEIRRKIQAEIDKFESWAYKVRPLLSNPDYQPTYEEKRFACQILGVRAKVWPLGYPQRCKLDIAPPNIMSLIS
jgi:site-specific DNA recombinase